MLVYLVKKNIDSIRSQMIFIDYNSHIRKWSRLEQCSDPHAPVERYTAIIRDMEVCSISKAIQGAISKKPIYKVIKFSLSVL